MRRSSLRALCGGEEEISPPLPTRAQSPHPTCPETGEAKTPSPLRRGPGRSSAKSPHPASPINGGGEYSLSVPERVGERSGKTPTPYGNAKSAARPPPKRGRQKHPLISGEGWDPSQKDPRAIFACVLLTPSPFRRGLGRGPAKTPPPYRRGLGRGLCQIVPVSRPSTRFDRWSPLIIIIH